jgi:hypothetical protein
LAFQIRVPGAKDKGSKEWGIPINTSKIKMSCYTGSTMANSDSLKGRSVQVIEHFAHKQQKEEYSRFRRGYLRQIPFTPTLCPVGLVSSLSL